MSDIFSRNASNLNGVFTADNTFLTLLGALGVLVQRLSVTYAQTISRIYEVGSSNVYYIGGRTQGQMGIERVIGPSGAMVAFYTQYGNVCNARSNLINMQLAQTDCSSPNAGTPSNFDILNCVITAVTIAVQAQDMVITDNTTLMFSSLEASDQSTIVAAAA